MPGNIKKYIFFTNYLSNMTNLKLIVRRYSRAQICKIIAKSYNYISNDIHF